MGDISLQDLALAMALSYGGMHPMGHLSKAGSLGVPGQVKGGVEMYDQNAWNKLSPAEQAKIHAAGFEGQQTFSNALTGSSMEEEARLANALYKLGYIAGIKPKVTEGDPELIAKTTGASKGSVNSMLGASALYDLYRARKPGKDSLDFGVIDSGKGAAPGLTYSWKW